MPSFGILQSQCNSAVAKVTSISLCSTMDLIAVLFSDYTIIIYRTLTWAKVLVNADLLSKMHSISLTHVAGDGAPSASSCADLHPHLLRFSPSGRVLGIGCRGGVFLSLDLETEVSYCCSALPVCVPADAAFGSLHWCPLNDDEHIFSASSPTHQQLQVDSLCQPVLGDETEGGGVIADEEASMRAQLLREHALVLGCTAVGLVVGYYCGIYPLFALDAAAPALCTVLSGHGFGRPHLAVVAGSSAHSDADIEAAAGGVSVALELIAHQVETSNLNPGRGQLRCLLPIGACPVPGSLSAFAGAPLLGECRVARLLVGVLSDLAQAQALLVGCARRWKDATKVVVPKMSLLRSLLDGYDLRMTNVEFLYSVVLCGHWHPAVQTHFATHWNPAGLARLLSAVDVAGQSVSKELCFRVLPLATNVSLRLQHIRAALSRQSLGSPADADTGTLCGLRRLQASCDQLLSLVDVAVAEAQRARDGMSLYVELIRHYAVDPGSAEEEEAAAAAAQTALAAGLPLRPAFLRMLDPRARRYGHVTTTVSTAAAAAGLSNPVPPGPAQPETVTGTFLFAYLQDQDLPAELAQVSVAEPGSGLGLLRGALAAAEAGKDSIDTDPRGNTRSLLGQVKWLREEVETLVILVSSRQYSEALSAGMLAAVETVVADPRALCGSGRRHWDSLAVDRFYYLSHAAPAANFGANANHSLAAVAPERVGVRSDGSTSARHNSVCLSTGEGQGQGGGDSVTFVDVTAHAYSEAGAVGVSIRDAASGCEYAAAVALDAELQAPLIESLWAKCGEAGGAVGDDSSAWQAALLDQYLLKAVRLYPRVSIKDSADGSGSEPVVAVDLVGLLTYCTAALGQPDAQPYYNVLFRISHADLVFGPTAAGTVSFSAVSLRHRVLDDAGALPANASVLAGVDVPGGGGCGANAVRVLECDADRGVACLLHYNNTLLVLDLEEEEEEEEEDAMAE